MKAKRKKRFLVVTNTSKGFRVFIKETLVGIGIGTSKILWIAGDTKSQIVKKHINQKRKDWRKKVRK